MYPMPGPDVSHQEGASALCLSATILEMNVDSYRRRTAASRQWK